MVGWTNVIAEFRQLDKAVMEGEPLEKAWAQFKNAVLETKDAPPNHMRSLFAEIEKCRNGRSIEDLDILDHGCGGNGINVLYLLALGYVGVRGVDVEGSLCVRWNRVLADCMGLDEPRLFTYDEQSLPFSDASMDVIFSHTVLEHVHPEVFDAFYEEEVRVLRQGGIAFHSVPHRFGPYDSHSRTWFLHWFLPRRPWVRVMHFLGRRGDVTTNHLFLRWPWVHKRAAKMYFGHVEDLTKHRLMDLTKFDDYDGPVGLRRILAFLVSFPAVGGPIATLASCFLQLDTVSRKN